MGKKCCYKNCCPPPCCPPCFPPCFPPPCCPPPCCPPFFCPPSCEWFAPGGECCESSCCSKKTDFLGQSSNSIDISSNSSTLLTFNEVRDCGCDYNNNSTFNPKCSGKYSFCVSVPITTTGSGTATVRIDLATSSGAVKASSSSFTTVPGSTTLNISSTVCLNKCDSLFVNLVVSDITGGVIVKVPATLRTFSGYTSKCKSCC